MIRCMLSKINPEKYDIKRAGVIPFVDVDGNMLKNKIEGNIRLWGFSIDRRYRELSDFGGKVEKKDNNSIEAALREFKEESLDSFPIPDNISECEVVIDPVRHMMIIFIPIDINPIDADNIFNSRVNKNSESYGIVWLSGQKIKNGIIFSGKIGSEIETSNSKQHKIQRKFYKNIKDILRYYFVGGDFIRNQDSI